MLSRLTANVWQRCMPSARSFVHIDPESPMQETIRDFLPPDVFYNQLLERGMEFFTGVPDSLLADFCGYIADNAPPEKHIITANEGLAVSVAAGYHMATRKFPVVYLQNSGIGNTINPLLSLTEARVYSIPMLMLIGWRGEPGKKDEPQHVVQGKIMNNILTDCGITYEVLPDFEEGASDALDLAIYHMQKRQSPYAFLVRRQCFLKYKLQNQATSTYEITREDAMERIVSLMGRFDATVATTGFAARELYELRKKLEQDSSKDFLCVGSMGHASSIAMGVSLGKPSKQVYCMDGDGAMLMHMGSIPQIGTRDLPNFKHILFNNESHDSVGGQPTVAGSIDIPAIAQACGYRYTGVATTFEEIESEMQKIKSMEGPVLLEIKCKRGTRTDLGRPKESPKQNKERFIGFLDQ